VLAEVHDRVGPPPGIQPPVEGEVVVGRGQVGAVVDGDRVLAEPPGRLHGHHGAAEVDPGEGQVVVVDAHLAGGGSPRRLDGMTEGGGQGREPRLVVVDVESPRGHGPLGRRQDVDVVGEAISKPGHHRIGIPVDRRDVVPRAAQRIEDRQQAGGRVEADRVADSAALGRVRRQDHGHSLATRRGGPQAREPNRQPRDPLDAVGQRPVGGHCDA
jgi:hypothetical protein